MSFEWNLDEIEEGLVKNYHKTNTWCFPVLWLNILPPNVLFGHISTKGACLFSFWAVLTDLYTWVTTLPKQKMILPVHFFLTKIYLFLLYYSCNCLIIYELIFSINLNCIFSMNFQINFWGTFFYISLHEYSVMFLILLNKS